ncbi:MAG: glucokinase [Desulfovibrio sp.]|nr:glucokinase [Desulfovibrio sp.]
MSVVLAADIGGTNCRLGLFRLDNGLLQLDRMTWIETGSVPHTEALLAAFERELEQTPHEVDAVVVAIAGPVEDCSRGRLTNGGLNIDFAPLNTLRRRFFLINDFMAQAYAVVSPEGEKAELIAGPSVPESDGMRAVIGAGTGLGQASLMRIDANYNLHTSQWLAIPSENGHAAFPFTSDEENECNNFMRKEWGVPFVTGDMVVSGRGLACLHQFLTGEKLTPPEVGRKALGCETRTLQWFSRFYARACRNWILTTLCNGGLWIAGGIAAQNPMLVKCHEFKSELYRHPQWENYLRSVPLYMMSDDNSGLWGSARFGQQQVGSAPRPN